MASRGASRRPLPILSTDRAAKICCQVLARGKKNLAKEKKEYPLKTIFLNTLVRSASRPETTFKMAATASPIPEIKPMAKPAPPRDLIKNGINGTIISEEKSAKREVKPSKITLNMWMTFIQGSTLYVDNLVD